MDDLTKKKIRAEINLINARISHEYPPQKPPTFWSKFSDFIKKWYAVALAVLTLGTAFWMLFMPIKNYYEEKRRQLEYALTGEMVVIVEKIDKLENDKKIESFMLLGYYEQNSIPVLLHFLQREQGEDSEQVRNTITSLLQNVSIDHGKDLLREIRKLLKLNLEAEIVSPSAENSSHIALIALIDLLNKLDLNEYLGSDEYNNLHEQLIQIKESCGCKLVTFEAASTWDTDEEEFKALCSNLFTFFDRQNLEVE